MKFQTTLISRFFKGTILDVGGVALPLPPKLSSATAGDQEEKMGPLGFPYDSMELESLFRTSFLTYFVFRIGLKNHEQV